MLCSLLLSFPSPTASDITQTVQVTPDALPAVSLPNAVNAANVDLVIALH